MRIDLEALLGHPGSWRDFSLLFLSLSSICIVK